MLRYRRWGDGMSWDKNCWRRKLCWGPWEIDRLGVIGKAGTCSLPGGRNPKPFHQRTPLTIRLDNPRPAFGKHLVKATSVNSHHHSSQSHPGSLYSWDKVSGNVQYCSVQAKSFPRNSAWLSSFGLARALVLLAINSNWFNFSLEEIDSILFTALIKLNFCQSSYIILHHLNYNCY